jgi:hypothetical protein
VAELALGMEQHHHQLTLTLHLVMQVLLVVVPTSSGWSLLTCLGLCLGRTLARAGALLSWHTCRGPAAWLWCWT